MAQLRHTCGDGLKESAPPCLVLNIGGIVPVSQYVVCADDVYSANERI